MSLRVLSLFSGIGGLELGLELAGMVTVGQCEMDPFACAVLEKHWPGIPRWNDVRHVTGESVRERCGDVDLVCGGFPCQDISSAGKGAGLSGERSGLWFEMLRVIREVGPRWVVAENVNSLRSRGADIVLGGLEAAGYSASCLVVGADDVGAPQRRKRVFIVGRALGDAEHAERRTEHEEHGEASRRTRPGRAGGELAHGISPRLEGRPGVTGDAREERSPAERGGDELADPSQRGREARPVEHGEALDLGRLDADGCGGDGNVADAAWSGRVRAEASQDAGADHVGRGRRDAADDGGITLPRWPPGPSDSAGWARVLAIEPGLAPAITEAESRFRVLAHVDTADLVRSVCRRTGWTHARGQAWLERNRVRLYGAWRRRVLKAAGNAVVPAVSYIIGRAVMEAHEATP